MVGRRHHSACALIMGVLILAVACNTPPDGRDVPTRTEDHKTTDRASDSVPPDRESADHGPPGVAELLSRAEEALSLGRHSEAIRLYADVAFLAAGSQTGNAAQTALDRITSGISLEPGAEWLAEDGTQLAREMRDLVRGGAPPPSVVATINEGPARVAVRGIALEFAFVVDGTPTGYVTVTTSEFGTASVLVPADLCTGVGLEVVVRPLTGSETGARYLDVHPPVFSYRGTTSLFGVAGLQLTGDRAVAAPDLADVVVDRLRPLGPVVVVDATAYADGTELGSGGAGIVDQIAGRTDASLLAVAFLDVRDVTRIQYQGRVYDIWKTDAVVRFAVYDFVGPRTLMVVSSDAFSGQGGSEGAALVDTARIAAGELRAMLTRHDEDLKALAVGPSE